MKKAYTVVNVLIIMAAVAAVAIICAFINPAELGEKNVAKRVLNELDKATTQILVDHSPSGTMSNLYELNTLNEFSAAQKAQGEKLGKLYENHLKTSPKKCETKEDCGECAKYEYKFFLKNGACVGISSGAYNSVETIFPQEQQTTPMNSTHGIIFFDTNAQDEPNEFGKDMFLIPLSEVGIENAMN